MHWQVKVIILLCSAYAFTFDIYHEYKFKCLLFRNISYLTDIFKTLVIYLKWFINTMNSNQPIFIDKEEEKQLMPQNH